MPIEIRELVIRARVDPSGDRPARGAASPAAGEARRREEIVRACVKEVLRVLEDKQER